MCRNVRVSALTSAATNDHDDAVVMLECQEAFIHALEKFVPRWRGGDGFFNFCI